MKKKFFSIMLALLMCVGVFAGCSLVERNDKLYYESVVATISYKSGEKDEITKRELIDAINSYGYNYVQNYGYTQEQAVKTTLETIIDRKLTIKTVENAYKEKNEELLNASETTYLWDQTYESLYSNVRSYLKDVPSSSENSSDEATNNALFKEYSKSATVSLSDMTIRKTSPATTIRETYTAREKDGQAYDLDFKQNEQYPFRKLLYDKLVSISKVGDEQSQNAWKSAIKEYEKVVKKSYSYVDFSDDEDAVLMFEIDRIYNIMKDNYIVGKYEILFNSQMKQGADLSNITIKDVLESYSQRVRADFAKYYLENDKSGFESAILSDVANVDYVLEGDGASKYFFVAPIKIEFSQTQKDNLAKWETQKNQGTITAKDYNEKVASLYNPNDVMVSVRDPETGEITGEMSAKNLLALIESDLGNDVGLPDEENEQNDKNIGYEKAEKFRKYLYLYNDDDTLKNAERNTVFGVSSSNEVLANETFNSNDKVKEAVLKLYQNGDAKVGDISDLIEADDGYYILFFAGMIGNNGFAVTKDFDASTNLDNITKLTTTRLNVFSNKTLFDFIYEQMSVDNFSLFQNLDIEKIKNDLTTNIEAIENNMNDLY